MKIHVRAQGVAFDEPLRQYVERRLLFAVGRFRESVRAVHVRLSDVNGPRGGLDKVCAISARLRGSGPIRVEDVDGHMRTAIDRAADRLARNIAREVDRRRTLLILTPRFSA